MIGILVGTLGSGMPYVIAVITVHGDVEQPLVYKYKQREMYNYIYFL